MNYETDFHDLIRDGKVKIFRQDLSHLSPRTVNLSDGTALDSPGGLITSVNWQWVPNLELKPASLHSDLGIPSVHYSDKQKQQWHALDAEADRTIFSKFSILKGTPQVGKGDTTQADSSGKLELEPFRLYRFLAPPGLTAKGDRSIVFQGFVANLLNQVRNEVTGLWAYAYLNNQLDIDEGKAEAQAALWSRFCMRRYPYGYGNRYPDFVFEQVPFFDRLLQDLGLPHRRKKGMLAEFFQPYMQADYRGLTAEWLDRQKKRS